MDDGLDTTPLDFTEATVEAALALPIWVSTLTCSYLPVEHEEDGRGIVTGKKTVDAS